MRYPASRLTASLTAGLTAGLAFARAVGPGAGAVRAQPADAALAELARLAKARAYSCVLFVPNAGLVRQGSITVLDGRRYRDQHGGAGTYAYDAVSGLVTFAGGAFAGQRAQYEVGRQPVLHLLGPSGRRAIDCT